MGFLKTVFSAIVFQPLYNALIILYVIIPDLGVTIIILTIIIRFLLMPLSKKSIDSQKKMQEIQPGKKLQEKNKHDKALQGQKVMEFYKEKKINPASGCLPMVIQLIFLIALYRVFMLGLGPEASTELLYGFVKNPGQLNPIAFGFFDLSVRNIPLAIIAAILQFFQAKMMLKKQQKDKTKKKKDDNEPDFSSMVQQQLVYMGPVITLIIGLQFPSVLILYWTVTTIFMIIQQYFVLNEDKRK